MELASNVKLHVIVPDTDPFILFGIEILTEFSRTIITKRFTDIARFQNQLCYFAHTEYQPGKALIEILPTLPFPQLSLMTLSDAAVEKRKKEVEKYFQALCNLYNLHSHQQSLPWIAMIRRFVSMDTIEQKQQKAARLLQRKFRVFRMITQQRQKAHQTFVEKGYVEKLEDLPNQLLIYIFSYFNIKDMFRVALVNRRWNQITEQPILWTHLNLFQSKIKIEKVRFQAICAKAWRLSTVDLRYCQFINSESLHAISQNCNPDNFKELYLDGCENIDDFALLMLCSTFLDKKKCELKGGARGLVKLSLAECRMISNEGVCYLRKLKKLEDLNILGCYSISDEGIARLVGKAKQFRKFNLSGTYVSREGLNAIARNCGNIQALILHGCRLLSNEDSMIFKNCHVELRDDIFRFQLLPTPETCLNSITNNILRTRSSLTIQRVAHYVFKKLQHGANNIDILCKGRVLSSYMTLRDVERDMWDNSMLTLYYRLKEETQKILENEKVENLMGKMPKWVHDDLVNECLKCHERFRIFVRKHHCRKCGNIFCDRCSQKRMFIPAFGYTKKPVRVCDNCAE
jgi:hypothetical protein